MVCDTYANLHTTNDMFVLLIACMVWFVMHDPCRACTLDNIRMGVSNFVSFAEIRVFLGCAVLAHLGMMISCLSSELAGLDISAANCIARCPDISPTLFRIPRLKLDLDTGFIRTSGGLSLLGSSRGKYGTSL